MLTVNVIRTWAYYGVHTATGKEIEKATQGIYPLQNTAIRKVKILRAPKFDLTKLLEVHGDYSEEAGAKIEKPAEEIVGATPAEA